MEGERQEGVNDSLGIIRELGKLPPDTAIPKEVLAKTFNRHRVSIKRATGDFFAGPMKSRQSGDSKTSTRQAFGQNRGFSPVSTDQQRSDNPKTGISRDSQ